MAVSEDWLLLEAVGAWRTCEATESVEEEEKKEQMEGLLGRWPPKLLPGVQKLAETDGQIASKRKDMEELDGASGKKRKRKSVQNGTNTLVGHEQSTEPQLRYLLGPKVEPRTKEQAHGDFLLERQRERQGAPAKKFQWKGIGSEGEADTRTHLQDCIESFLFLKEDSTEGIIEEEDLERETMILRASVDTAARVEEALMKFLGVDLQVAQPAIARDNALRKVQSSTSKKAVPAKNKENSRNENRVAGSPVHACKGKVPNQTLQLLIGCAQSHSVQAPPLASTGNAAWEPLDSSSTQPLQTDAPDLFHLSLLDDEERFKDACLHAGIDEQAFIRAHKRLADLYSGT